MESDLLVTFTDGYIGNLTNAIVTCSGAEIPTLLKACTTAGNCICYPESREEEWLEEMLNQCEQNGSNHVCDIFSDNRT